MSTTGDGTIHGQDTNRHLVSPLGSEMSATRFSCHLSATKQDLLSSDYANMPRSGSRTGCASGMTVSTRVIPGPFLNVTSQTATACEITDILGDPQMSFEHNDRDDSSSYSSSSDIEGVDHIYHTIHPKCPHKADEYKHTSSHMCSRPSQPSCGNPRPRSHRCLALGGTGLTLVTPKSPPPKLWNSPKPTMSHRKLPPIPSSYVQSASNVSTSSGIATADNTRGASPSTVVEVKPSGDKLYHGSTACQATSSKTKALNSTPCPATTEDSIALSNPQIDTTAL